MAARPTVSVHAESGDKIVGSVPTPAVFKTPINPAVVNLSYKNIAKNRRQPYAVSEKAGHQTSAESWGTGRAVARIPRVNASGTHRAGQAAFGNMCRGGRMFAPTKVWRKWHVKTNVNQKRYAVASALAASAVPALVLARGHRVERIPEVPLVIADGIESISKTKAAVALLKSVHAYSDVQKVSSSRKVRPGQGKLRNRRHRQRRGPLVVYANDKGIKHGFRNLPGVELVHVDRLNLLQLAPGSHLGRFIIWSESAFKRLDELYGTYSTPSALKSGYSLPQPLVANTDITRIINSAEIQKTVRPAGPKKQKRPYTQHKNPLKNTSVMVRLNPYAAVLRRNEILNKNKKVKTTKEAKKGKAAASARFLEILKAD